MSTIDRQRIAAVKALEAMGYRFREDNGSSPTQLADRQKLTPCTRCSSTARISWRGTSKCRRRSRSIRPSSEQSMLMSRGVGLMARRRVAKASCLAPAPDGMAPAVQSASRACIGHDRGRSG